MLRLSLRVGKPNDEAAPNAVMRRCNACSGAHNLTIAARLTSRCALPDSMMLASSSGFTMGARRNSLRSNRPTRFFRPYLRCSARSKGILGKALKIYGSNSSKLFPAFTTALFKKAVPSKPRDESSIMLSGRRLRKRGAQFLSGSVSVS